MKSSKKWVTNKVTLEAENEVDTPLQLPLHMLRLEHAYEGPNGMGAAILSSHNYLRHRPLQ